MIEINIETFFEKGCGRCDKFDTPDCKVNPWRDILLSLREIINTTELKEELKWNQPTYTINGKNVLILSTLKDFPFISFLKGSLLKDPKKILVSPGKRSQADRRIVVTDIRTIEKLKPTIKSYIEEAIELEKAGKKVEFKKGIEPMPEELMDKLDEDPELKEAFEKLTPGRQRSYFIHINGAKQSSTRASRVEKCIPKIMAGKGFLEY